MTRTAGRIAAALALAFVAIVHVAAAYQLAHRSYIDVDEIEFLHGALRMARGERLYVDFSEHHPPFVFEALRAIDGDSVERYVVRARLAMSFCGIVAVAAAAFLVWRATRQLYAPAIFIGMLAATPGLWLRAFADVRDEPPSLALWWVGALLVVASRRVSWGAVGLGLVALGSLVNPKWPIASVVIGIFFLASFRRPLPRALLLGSIALAAAFGVLCAATNPRFYLEFVVGLSRIVLAYWRLHGPQLIGTPPPFFYCPIIFQPRFVLPAALVVLAAAIAAPDAFRNLRAVACFLSLLVAALLEIRFIHPYPVLWVQYYIVWGMAAAAIDALVPAATLGLLRRFVPRVAPAGHAVAAVITIVAVIGAVGVLPLPGDSDPSAVATAKLERELAPGDTVFVDLRHHPIAARDAGYYWFGMLDVIPASLQYAVTPRGRTILPPIGENDLPPCRLERGLEPHLRLVEAPLPTLPVVAGCIERLRARGVLVPSGVGGVLLVRRGGA